MIHTHKTLTGASLRAFKPSSSIQSCVFQRYSSSSSSSSNSPDINTPPQETKEIEKETTEETIKASTVDGSLKSSVSTQPHTSSIGSSTGASPQQNSTPFASTISPKSSKSTKHSSSSSKSARSFKTKPVTYNVPYVPSTQHINIERIYEDTFHQDFRPLITPIKDLRRYMSLTIPAPPPKNNKAYWNTSACQVEEFASLDCVPKFIGDSMKAFKVPPPPGNEIRIYPRDEDPGKLSSKMKKYVKKELEKERQALEAKKITAYRYYNKS